MTYEQLIIRATVHKDKEAAWQIVQQFEPFINKQSYNTTRKCIDEDLKSEIQLQLFLRILNNFQANSIK